ncbi:hypothetical protein [Leucobacter sp. gxy201]|uniref:hypothetical protein n=1 Tax=Leucobacter sp. gxy201 TaxID=2957200 RepID=UPI003DA0EC5C
MSNSDPAARPEGAASTAAGESAAAAENPTNTPTPAVDADTVESARTAADAADAADASPAPHEPVIVTSEQTVELQRSVRYGRVLIGAAVLGALILSLASLVMPLDPESEYSMAQIVGFMALIGAAVGLGVGAILSVVLTAVAKRGHGSGVAIQTDVR